MPLPAPDWSAPATHYGPQALDPASADHDQHDRDATFHAHDIPANTADLGPLLTHLTAYPAGRGAPGWVAHFHRYT